MNNIDLLKLYRNYLFALEIRKEYGDKFGDIDELIKMYEDKLEENGVKVKENVKDKK